MARLDARLTKLEAAHESPDALPGPGLAALLAYARRHPVADRDAHADLDAAPDRSGMEQLLAEARQWLEAQQR